MTQDDFDEYWRPVRDRLINYRRPTSLQGSDASTRLASALGYEYPVPASWNKITLTEELKTTLRALNNPHCETLLKVIELRKERP